MGRKTKRQKFALTAFSAFLLTIAWTLPVFANSSWVWLTDVRPYWLLPAVVLITLLIESFSVIRFAGIKNKPKAAGVIAAANLISFATPYIFILLFNDGFGMRYYLENTPFYTVGGVFLAMTLACELPAVYNMLKKEAESRRALFWAAFLSNVATTALTAAAERGLCYGRW